MIVSKCRTILSTELNAFQLAGFEHLTRLFKSLILPIGLLDGALPLEEALQAALAESESQAEKWGTIQDHHPLQLSQMRKSALLGHLLMTAPSAGEGRVGLGTGTMP